MDRFLLEDKITRLWGMETFLNALPALEDEDYKIVTKAVEIVFMPIAQEILDLCKELGYDLESHITKILSQMAILANFNKDDARYMTYDERISVITTTIDEMFKDFEKQVLNKACTGW